MAKGQVAVYPGVFDPATLGHLDIIQRGAAIFDGLIVAVAAKPDKQCLFAAEERVAMMREAVTVEGVTVDSYDGLTVEFVRSRGASVILRGLRHYSDFEYEYQLALTNRTIAGIETVFVMADERVAYISSRLVREVASLGGDVSKLVPPNVAEALKARLGKAQEAH
ncbi:MAG: pantetheine-phosphate adenylyltransferase [Phycisphaerae bacterium]